MIGTMRVLCRKRQCLRSEYLKGHLFGSWESADRLSHGTMGWLRRSYADLNTVILTLAMCCIAQMHTSAVCFIRTLALIYAKLSWSRVRYGRGR